MADFKLFTDTTCDYPYTYFDEQNIELISHGFTMEGVTIMDDCGRGAYDLPSVYKRMREEKLLVTTNMPNLDCFLTQFPVHLEQGLDILYLCFSSHLSSTFMTVHMAAKELLEKYPERRIAIVDSRCASLGQALFVHKAVAKRAEGASFDELIAYCEELRDHILHYFVVDDLDYLHRGGRLSKTAAFVGGLLGMKPILHCNIDGKILPLDKVRGRKAALDKTISIVADEAVSPQDQIIHVCHADCMEDAQYVKQQLVERLAPKEVVISPIGPVITAHAGPGTLAIIALGEKRRS